MYAHDTSGVAFQRMKDKPLHLDNLQKEIAKLLYSSPRPLCELEITKTSGIERCSTTARLHKMREKGLVEIAGKFQSPYSNIRVAHYQLTERGREYLSPTQLKIFEHG